MSHNLEYCHSHQALAGLKIRVRILGASYSVSVFQCAGLPGLLWERHKRGSFPQTTLEHVLFNNLHFSEFSFVLITDHSYETRFPPKPNVSSIGINLLRDCFLEGHSNFNY